MNSHADNRNRERSRLQRSDRALVAALALLISLTALSSPATAQYYTDPNYPGWVWHPSTGWIYVGQEPEQPAVTTPAGNSTGSSVSTGVSRVPGGGGGGRRRMVAVGIDEYLRASSLPSCINDVDGLIAAVSTDTARWSADSISRLVDGSATKHAVRTALYNMAMAAAPGDVCVFFQSSHGAQISGTSMSLVMFDDYYSDQEFGVDLANWFSEDVTVVVIIDACFSGGLFKGDASDRKAAAKSFGSFSQNVMNAMQQTRNAGAKNSNALEKAGLNVGFITASDFNETSSAGNPYSLFAGQMIAAFASPGSDTNGDGQLSFLEVFNFAAPRSQNGQTPQAANGTILDSTIVAKHAPSDVSTATAAMSGGLCGVSGLVQMMLCVSLMGAMRSTVTRRRAGVRSVQRRRIEGGVE